MVRLVVAGGLPDTPHIHQSISEYWLVKSRDWGSYSPKGSRCLVKPDTFYDIYEEIDTAQENNEEELCQLN